MQKVGVEEVVAHPDYKLVCTAASEKKDMQDQEEITNISSQLCKSD